MCVLKRQMRSSIAKPTNNLMLSTFASPKLQNTPQKINRLGHKSEGSLALQKAFSIEFAILRKQIFKMLMKIYAPHASLVKRKDRDLDWYTYLKCIYTILGELNSMAMQGN